MVAYVAVLLAATHIVSCACRFYQALASNRTIKPSARSQLDVHMHHLRVILFLQPTDENMIKLKHVLERSNKYKEYHICEWMGCVMMMVVCCEWMLSMSCVCKEYHICEWIGM